MNRDRHVDAAGCHRGVRVHRARTSANCAGNCAALFQAWIEGSGFPRSTLCTYCRTDETMLTQIAFAYGFSSTSAHFAMLRVN